MKSTEEILFFLLEECTGKRVRREMELVDELEMDSIKILEFVLAIENNFNIEFNEFSELSQHMVTVGEMVDYLNCFLDQGVNGNERICK